MPSDHPGCQQGIRHTDGLAILTACRRHPYRYWDTRIASSRGYRSIQSSTYRQAYSKGTVHGGTTHALSPVLSSPVTRIVRIHP